MDRNVQGVLNFSKESGLIPAVVQDAVSHKVLMLGYMSAESLEQTMTTGHVTFYSRSRKKLWTKGESSGHFLNLRSVRTDCDGDALLIEVEPIGPGVCHEGFQSCFFRQLVDGEWKQADEKSYDPSLVYGTVQ